MTMISKAAVGIAVGIAGIFVGYCFYFDQKRRSDPEFKTKLRERKSSYSFRNSLEVFLKHVIHVSFISPTMSYEKNPPNGFQIFRRWRSLMKKKKSYKIVLPLHRVSISLLIYLFVMYN